MLLRENSKLEHNIFLLELDIKEKQTKLNELKEKLENNKKLISEGKNKELIQTFSKTDATLYNIISALPEEQRIGWKEGGNFRCPLCKQTFWEGFVSSDLLNSFFFKNPHLKHLSNYCLKHTQYSICYKNQFCSHCDENDIEYDQFTFSTQRVRHMRKHKDEGICVPCNKADKSKDEIIAMFQEQAIKFGKRKLPNVVPKFKLKEPEDSSGSDTVKELSEEEEQSSSSPEPIIKKIIKRKKLKIVSPTASPLDYDTDYSITTVEDEDEEQNTDIKSMIFPLSISRPIYNIR